MVGRGGLEPPKPKAKDLQSFGIAAIRPTHIMFWCNVLNHSAKARRRVFTLPTIRRRMFDHDENKTVPKGATLEHLVLTKEHCSLDTGIDGTGYPQLSPAIQLS